MTHAEWQIGDSRVTWPLLEQVVYLLVHLHNALIYSIFLSFLLFIFSSMSCFFQHLFFFLFFVCKKTFTTVQDADESEGKRNCKSVKQMPCNIWIILAEKTTEKMICVSEAEWWMLRSLFVSWPFCLACSRWWWCMSLTATLFSQLWVRPVSLLLSVVRVLARLELSSNTSFDANANVLLLHQHSSWSPPANAHL